MLGGGGGCGGPVSWCSEVWRCSPKVAPDPMSPSATPMDECDQCSAKFTLLKRRKICNKCSLAYCGSCIKKNFLGNRQCNKCIILSQWPLEMSEVMALRVKDLRNFLHAQHINTIACTEKRDLIDLVTRHISSQRCGGGGNISGQRINNHSPFSRPPFHTPHRPNPPAAPPPAAPHVAPARDDGIRVRATDCISGSIRVRPGRPISPDLSDYDPETDLGIRVFATSSREGSQEQDGRRGSREEERGDPSPAAQSEGGVEDGGSCNCANEDCNNSCCCSLDSCHITSSASRTRLYPDLPRVDDTEGGGGGSGEGGHEETMGEEGQEAGSSPLMMSEEAPFPTAPVLEAEDGEEGEEEEPPATASATSSTSTLSSAAPSTASSPEPTKTNLSDIVALRDLKCEEDIQGLSVRQCKQLLALHRVNFSGVREKSELLSKIKILWKDYQSTRQEVDTLPEDMVCKICMDHVIDCVLLECGHMVSCTQCGKQMSECPVCRQYVVRVVRTFRA